MFKLQIKSQRQIKNLTLTLALGVLSHTTAFAQSGSNCRTVEFAELQAMNRNELKLLYCTNKIYIESHNKRQISLLESSKKSSELAREYVSIRSLASAQSALDDAARYRREAGKYGEFGDLCRSENERVLRAMKKGEDDIATPECN